MRKSRSKRNSSARIRSFERLEDRRMLVSPWQNPINAFDVTDDGYAAAPDVLQMVSELENRTIIANDGKLPPLTSTPPAYYDVNGDEFLSAGDVLDAVFAINHDLDPPTIEVALANDTASGGTTNDDGVTSDATITGFARDVTGILGLIAFVDDDFAQPVKVEKDGSFTFHWPFATDGQSDGFHSVHFEAADLSGQTARSATVTFQLDTVAPVTPTLVLDAASDTAPVGDGETEQDTVMLTGTAESGSAVTLSPGNVSTIAGDQGTFSFDNVILAEGDNQFTVSSTDTAGNSSAFSVTIVRTEIFEQRLLPSDGNSDTGEIVVTGSVEDQGSDLDSQRSKVAPADVIEVAFDSTEVLGLPGAPSENRSLLIVGKPDYRSDDPQAGTDSTLDNISTEIAADVEDELRRATDLAFSQDWSALLMR